MLVVTGRPEKLLGGWDQWMGSMDGWKNGRTLYACTQSSILLLNHATYRPREDYASTHANHAFDSSKIASMKLFRIDRTDERA